jgi:hypothetical protein
LIGTLRKVVKYTVVHTVVFFRIPAGYQGINTLLKTSFFVSSTFYLSSSFFVHREHCWGNHMGKYMG